MSTAVDRFRALAAEERFKGWPLVGEPRVGPPIPFFGTTLRYKLRTGNGVEEYTSILRHFGWTVVFGIIDLTEQESPAGHHGPHIVTLCQWKPGVNQASWELPPGGIGRVSPYATIAEITTATQATYLKETGLSSGDWRHLGHIMIETGKYRGASPYDHGLPAHLFLARDLKRVQGGRNPNPNEIMENLLVPLSEFREVLESGLFVEESAVACAYKALIELGLLHW